MSEDICVEMVGSWRLTGLENSKTEGVCWEYFWWVKYGKRGVGTHGS